eukprot:jgi/Tetstr1/454172/TSEL_041091.t1
MNALNRDLLADIFRRVQSSPAQPRNTAACRLVCREWRSVADAVAGVVRSDFLSCRPDAGADAPSLTVSTSRSPRAHVRFETDPAPAAPSARAARAAACRMLECAGVRADCAGLRRKVPVRVVYEGGPSRGVCALLRGMAATLREIDLTGPSGAMAGRTRRALCQAAGEMPALVSFRAPSQGVTASDAAALARSPSLREVVLSNNAVGDRGCRELAAVATIRSLNLSNNDMPGAAVRHLARLSDLRSLDLSFGSAPDWAVAEALAGMPGMAALSLPWNDIGPRTGRVLAGMQHLRTLDLGFSDVALCGHLPASLAELDFACAGIGDAELRQIAARCPGLRALRLSNNRVSAAGLTRLAETHGDRLVELELGWNCLEYGAALSLAEGMTALQRLDIKCNNVLDIGALALFDMPALRALNVSQNNLSRTARQHLRHRARRRPDLTLHAY